MEVVVFTSKNSGRSGTAFIDKLSDLGSLNVRHLYYEDTIIAVKDGAVLIPTLDTESCNLIYLRGKGYPYIRHALALYCDQKGIAVVNAESFNFQCMTKLEQTVSFVINNIPVPDSVFVYNRDQYQLAVNSIRLSYPLVAKAIEGKDGIDNILVNNLNELLNIPFDNAIIQKFQPNNFDYRVVVAGDKVLTSYKRIRSPGSDGHTNNISQGGSRQYVDLPIELCAMAVKAANSINRNFTGVDIITNNKTGYSFVLEANYNFGTPLFDDLKDEKEYYFQVASYFKELANRKSILHQL